MNPDGPDLAEALRRREEAVRVREDRVAQREAAADAAGRAAQALRARLDERLLQGRRVNERLVVASLQSQALTEAAEGESARKDEFLAMLAHELRNPLAPIHNGVAILGRIAGDDPRLVWVRDMIERQVVQMARLLDDLLDAARVRSGKVTLRKRPVTADEFIGQAVESCRMAAEARDQRLTVDLPTEPVCVDGDPLRLTQVFSNLLNNAVKYTGLGGAIAVRARATDAELVVCVRDDGRGIAEEALPHIFELFSQEDRSLAHAQGGLGIGLTVVRRLVELHGGSVEATSAGLDRGAEFVVRLPLARVAAPPVRSVRPANTPVSHPVRIVVIEDNIDSNDSLCALLRLAGHEVASAYDGNAGVALVQSSRPQLVICDLGLPGLNGLGVAARLRDDMRGALPLMVALSGYGGPQDAADALAAGFARHLTKPVDPEALLRLIDECAEGIVGESN